MELVYIRRETDRRWRIMYIYGIHKEGNQLKYLAGNGVLFRSDREQKKLRRNPKLRGAAICV